MESQAVTDIQTTDTVAAPAGPLSSKPAA